MENEENRLAETARSRKPKTYVRNMQITLFVLSLFVLGLMPAGFFLIRRDFIKRQHAESALLESEERFRSVTKSANDAIIAADSRGNIISWNDGAERIFGYTEEEISGKPMTVLMPEKIPRTAP
jgi:PAS domain-containing protein